MAAKSVHWGRPLVHSDEWKAPPEWNEVDNYNNDYFNDNTPREDRPTGNYDEAEEDYTFDDDAEYDDDFDVNQYDDENDDLMYEDDGDDWLDFERDYEYDYREHSGLCTGYNDDYNDDD
jgi:hypothetical protein